MKIIRLTNRVDRFVKIQMNFSRNLVTTVIYFLRMIQYEIDALQTDSVLL